MHGSSYALMADFVRRYVPDPVSVADVGSQRVVTPDCYDYLYRCRRCGAEYRRSTFYERQRGHHVEDVQICKSCHKRQAEIADDGTYRPLFAHCVYTGLDTAPGENVDRVVEPYDFGAEQYDVVISGQCLEHVEDTVRWVSAFTRICRPGGLMCIIAPSAQAEHRFPIDCWRILPDGVRWLFRDQEVLECRLVKGGVAPPNVERVEPWQNRSTGNPEQIDDTILIARRR